MPKHVKFFLLSLSFLSVILSVIIAVNVSRLLSRAETVVSIPPGTQVVPVFTDNKANKPVDTLQMKRFSFVTIAPAGSVGVSDQASGYVPPTTNRCGGKYSLATSHGKNYGDPNCTFTKDRLFALLKQTDPKHANLWFMTIVPRESGYDPTVVGWPPGQSSIDAGGAWGLYQMGSTSPAGKAPPAPGKNGPLDRGDVNWEMQTTNAIGYNRKQNCGFRYWAAARSVWGALTC